MPNSTCPDSTISRTLALSRSKISTSMLGQYTINRCVNEGNKLADGGDRCQCEVPDPVVGERMDHTDGAVIALDLWSGRLEDKFAKGG